MHRVPLAQREYLVVRVVGKTPRPAETTTRHCQPGGEGHTFGADSESEFLGLQLWASTPVASPAALRHHPRQEPRALTRMRGSVRGDWRKPVPYRDEALRMRMHLGEHEVAIWLGRVIKGWLNYYAVPGTSRTLANFVQAIRRMLMRTLRRRSQRDRYSWPALDRLIGFHWPKPTIRHPWPSQRLIVNTRGRSRMR